MKFFEIGAEVLVPKFTRTEVQLPETLRSVTSEEYSANFFGLPTYDLPTHSLKLTIFN